MLFCHRNAPDSPLAAKGETKASGRNRFTPDSTATGAHSTFRRDPDTGKTTHYETYQPQTNPRNPRAWESVKRYDGNGKGHHNKVLGRDINTPHIHEKKCPGEIRPAEEWEIP